MAKSFIVDTGGTLTTGLVSYYKMGDGRDFYGTNHGTASNVTFGSSYGKYNNGGSFNGSSSHIKMGGQASNAIPLSWSCWFKPGVTINSSTGTTHTILEQGTTGASPALAIPASSGYLRFYIYKDPGPLIDVRTNTTSWTSGTWYHAVVTVNSSGVAKIYINGTDDTASGGTSQTSGLQFASYFNIGNSDYYNANYFNGSIDEVGIWSKALSTTEISDLYNSGNGQTMNPPIEFISVAHDTDANASLSMPVTVSGNNPYLLLFMRPYSTGNNGDVLTSCQFNGVDMTRINYTSGGANNSTRYYSYYMANPPAGTYNVTATASVTMDGGWNATAVVYAGLKNQAPEATSSVTNSNNSALSTSVTTVSDGAWVIAGYDGSLGDGSVGTGTLLRYGTNPSKIFESSSNPITNSGTSVTINMSGATTNSNWSNWLSVVSLAPYVAAAGPTNLKSFNGVLKAGIKSINGTAIGSIKSINGVT